MLRIRNRIVLGIPDPLVRAIRILLSSSKNSKKILIPTVLGLLYDFVSLKNDVNLASKSMSKKIMKKLVAILKFTDENSRIQIRQSKMRIRIRNIGSI